MKDIERTEGFVIVEPIASSSGKKRVLPGAKKTIACTLDKFGNIKHGFTKEEVAEYENEHSITMDRAYWADFRVVLSDSSKTFDLSNPHHRLHVKFLRQHPMVADIGEAITQKTIYRMIDEEFEADKAAGKLENKTIAYKYLESMDADDARGFLRLYGVKGDKLSKNVIMKRLNENLEDNVDKFIKLFEDKNKDWKILLKELVTFEVVRKNKTHFYWGEIHLGENEEIAVTFLRDKENQEDTLIPLKKELAEKRKLV